jgi:hypothetical protein
MIVMTDQALTEAGEEPISRWRTVPEPGDTDSPVPPAWEYADPNESPGSNAATTQFLIHVKSDEYFERTMKVREAFLTEPGNLRRLSLGALGNIAEMTIHNMMHMRWAADPGGYRPSIDLSDPAGGDPKWDQLAYDYLGDTYSSHVNPHFWYLHGWIDNLINHWADANGVQNIEWTGNWVGGPDIESSSSDAEMAMPGLEAAAVLDTGSDEVRAALGLLAGTAADLPFPTSLIEIAQEQGG